MAEQYEVSHFLKELFPAAGAELLRLMQSATENASLLRSDFYAIRDWLEIAGYREQDVPQAILLLMMVALEEGSVCIEVASPLLLHRLRDLVPDEQASAWADRMVNSLDAPGYPELIGTSPADHKPIILYQTGGRRFLYFQRYLRAEIDFFRELNRRLQTTATTSAAGWSAIIGDVLRDQPLQLDRDQRLALGMALLSDFAIISGGPGTGKTSIVLTLLRCLVRGGVAPERITLAAPTGRAAQRLSDSLRAGLDPIASAKSADSPDAPLRNLAATTLHSLLGYRANRNLFGRHHENPIEADVVIVDEVSMIGIVLMSQLLQALGPKTKLVLLGDKDQLPSVEAGAVLANLVPEQAANGFDGAMAVQIATLFPDLAFSAPAVAGPLQNRVVLLQTNHRSQHHIRETALAINQQDGSVVDRLPVLVFPADAALEPCWQELETNGGCRLLEQTQRTPNELRGFLQHWAEQAYFCSKPNGNTLASLVTSIELSDVTEPDPRFAELFMLLDRFRLLTLVRESAWGCEEINAFLDQWLRPRLGADSRTGLFAGAPVLIMRNDAARGLYNGDVGVTLHRRGGGLAALFARQDAYVAIPAEGLPTHQLGFALTVHKSQGSEYANVMLVLPPTGGKRLLTKELIYTAITRAKSLAVICAAKDVLSFAIERCIMRESGVIGG